MFCSRFCAVTTISSSTVWAYEGNPNTNNTAKKLKLEKILLNFKSIINFLRVGLKRLHNNMGILHDCCSDVNDVFTQQRYFKVDIWGQSKNTRQ